MSRPILQTSCAFCSRGLSHERACVTEATAWSSFGLRFDSQSLLLTQPGSPFPEPELTPLSPHPKPLLSLDRPVLSGKRRGRAKQVN